MAAGEPGVLRQEDKEKKWYPDEVFDYIQAQNEWNDEEKSGMRTFYSTFISMLGDSKMPTADKFFKEQVIEMRTEFKEGYGIIV